MFNFNRFIKNLTPTHINWIAGMCALFYFIPALPEFQFSLNGMTEFLSTAAASIALYITVWGILPLRNEIDKILSHIILPPLVIASKEDYKYIKAIREYFSEIDTSFEDRIKELPDILKFCGIENDELVSKIENCLNNVNNQDCPSKDAAICYGILRDRIKNYQIIIILFYDNSSEAWLTSRINLYTRIQAETEEHILNKVILCTDKDEMTITKLFNEETINKLGHVMYGKFNVDKLASCINTKLARKRS